MAKTSFQLIPAEYDVLYKKALVSGERFVVPRVRRKVLFLSRKRIKGLTEKSLIPSLSVAWAGLSEIEQQAWVDSGDVCGLTGFKHFLKDRAYRIKNELAGYATPSLLHQVQVGLLRIEAPSDHIKIEQLHPQQYWVSRKVRGTRSQYEPVLVTENFGLPVELSISYRSDLTETASGAFARFYVVVYSNYQGSTIENRCTIDFPLSHDWELATASIENVIGLPRGYTAFLEIHNATGDLYVDNISIQHSGQNWCRDPNCNDIDQGFTKAFYQVPKHWNSVDVPAHAFFGSVYYNL